jgi:hypothetical protein
MLSSWNLLTKQRKYIKLAWEEMDNRFEQLVTYENLLELTTISVPKEEMLGRVSHRELGLSAAKRRRPRS